MIDITDYTSYDEIRAVLGLDAIELTDESLALDLYASVLQRTLRGTTDSSGKSLYTYYDELYSSASTDDEETLLGLLREFSTYTVAVACLPGLSFLIKKSESDGKANITRFSSEATFKDVANNVSQKLNEIRTEILTMVGASTSYNAITPLKRVAPDSDPVTG